MGRLADYQVGRQRRCVDNKWHAADWVDKQLGRREDRQTNMREDRQTNMQADGQKGRWADKQEVFIVDVDKNRV
jgi:hypothetical protein